MRAMNVVGHQRDFDSQGLFGVACPDMAVRKVSRAKRMGREGERGLAGIELAIVA